MVAPDGPHFTLSLSEQLIKKTYHCLIGSFKTYSRRLFLAALIDILPYLITGVLTAIASVAGTMKIVANSGVKSLEKFHDNLQKSHDKHEEELSNLREQMAAKMATEAAEERRQRLLLQHDIQIEREARTLLSDEVEQIKAKLNQLVGERNMLDAKNVWLQEELAKAHQQIGMRDTTIENLEQQVSGLIDQLAAAEKKGDDEARRLNIQLGNLSKELKVVTSERDELKEKAAELEKQIVRLSDAEPTNDPSVDAQNEG